MYYIVMIFFLGLMVAPNLFVYLVSLDLEFMIDYILILYFFSTMDERLHIKEEDFDAECSIPKHFTVSKCSHIEIKEESEHLTEENVKVKQEIDFTNDNFVGVSEIKTEQNDNFVGVCEIKTEQDDSMCEDFVSYDDPLKDYSVHEEKKSVFCGICKAKFQCNANLNVHVASVHEGKKPFKCDLCNTSFTQKSVLKHHILSVHEKKKLFKCDICHVDYAKKDSLKKHIASVHEGNKQYKCRICDAAFTSRNAMIEHKSSIHTSMTSLLTHTVAHSYYQAFL